MRILCVEDDADSREMMTIILEQAGYEVVAASNPADGLKIAKHDAPALIILDNWYDRGSGVELCKQIRQFDSRTPIIFYSGAAFQSDVRKAMDAGAQGYLIKPVGIRDLIATIEVLTK
jgi:DNA-binding response OmpR family regulator